MTKSYYSISLFKNLPKMNFLEILYVHALLFFLRKHFVFIHEFEPVIFIVFLY